MKLIGFSGGMGSGKTTAIEYMRFLSKNNAVILVKFAGPLYDIQEFIYGVVQPVHKREPGFIKDRKLLQWIGTEWGRSTISDTVWVDLWKAKVLDFHRNNTTAIIVCDDVRFDNEADSIHSLGGKVVRLEAPSAETRAEGGIGIVSHSSESGISIDKCDYVVHNTGTIAEYKTALGSLYRGFLHI